MEYTTLKNRNFLLAIGLIVVAVAALIFVLNCFFKPPSFEEVMKEPTKLLNKQSMTMIDRETRFDSGAILPNKVFQYSYTLINQDTFTVNVKGLKTDVYPVLLKRVKTDPDFQLLRENKATILYQYRDKNGKTLFNLFFTPKQYLK